MQVSFADFRPHASPNGVEHASTCQFLHLNFSFAFHGVYLVVQSDYNAGAGDDYSAVLAVPLAR